MRRPQLVTFDIFGTVADWRTGLEAACRKAGRPLRDGEFDRVVDVQGELEQGEGKRGDFLDYATVTRRSLTGVLGLDQTKAADIGAEVGTWPLHPDAPVLGPLMRIAPCGAMTNSDRRHGQEIQARLGFSLDVWLCSEDIQLYQAAENRVVPCCFWGFLAAGPTAARRFLLFSAVLTG